MQAAGLEIWFGSRLAALLAVGWAGGRVFGARLSVLPPRIFEWMMIPATNE